MTTKSPYFNRFLRIPIPLIKRKRAIQIKYVSSKLRDKKPWYDSVEDLFEQAGSVKLYKDHKNLVLGLRASSLRLFLLIGFNLRNGKDYIKLVQLDVMKTLDVSRKTYYNALSELIDKRIIYRENGMSVGKYFINPHIFFAGSLVSSLEKIYEDKTDEIFEIVHTIEE